MANATGNGQDATDLSDKTPSKEEIEASIAALETQRAILGDAIGPAIAALRAQPSGEPDEPRSTEDQRKQINRCLC